MSPQRHLFVCLIILLAFPMGTTHTQAQVPSESYINWILARDDAQPPDDSNGDGLVDSADAVHALVTAPTPIPTTTPTPTPVPTATPTPTPTPVLGADFRLRRTSPSDGEAGVAIMREFQLFFTEPVDPSTVDLTSVAPRFGTQELEARLEVAPDGGSATIFFPQTLPAGTQVTVRVRGDLILNEEGTALDADSDGTPGGVKEVTFQTVSLSAIPGTGFTGRIFASEPAPARAAKGTFVNRPLEGVRVFVQGREDTMSTFTDNLGNFTLQNVPSGDVFVFIDGRTVATIQDGSATAYPQGPYYPFVGKKWRATPGRLTDIPTIYLPLVAEGTLQPTSTTEPTEIRLPASVLEQYPDFSEVALEVPANGLFADDGTRGGLAGIAPVESDRLPDPLPEGLDLPIVITVQTDGATNFSQPAPVSFPNLPPSPEATPLPPGSKSALWSFDHDLGSWVIAGSMTVSDDGMLVTTDPGVGIIEPGWHGTAPGSDGDGGGGDGGEDDDCRNKENLAKSALIQCGVGVIAGILELAPGVGCAVSIAAAAAGTAVDCSIDPSGCSQTAMVNAALAALGCIPGAGLTGNILGCLTNAIAITDYLLNCSKARAQAGLTLDDVRRMDTVLQQQRTLLLSQQRAATAVLGSDVWTNLDAGDVMAFQAMINALEVATREGSDSGAMLSDAEKDQIRSLAPASVDPSIVEDLISRIETALTAGPNVAFDLNEIEASMTELSGVSEDLANEAWINPLTGMDRIYEVIQTSQDIFREGQGSNPAISSGRRFAAGPHYWRLTRIGELSSRRGQLDPSGRFPSLIVAPQSRYLIEYVNVYTLEYGARMFLSGANGDRFTIPPVLFGTPPGMDSDGDLLFDICEEVIGTDPFSADTDGDGVQDGAEVLAGTSPLGDVLLATGVIGNVPVPGSDLRDIDTGDNLAVVADISRSVMAFNIFAGQSPVLVGQVDFDSTVLKVAMGGNGLVLAALGAGGAAVVDFSDPPNAEEIARVNPGSLVVAIAAAGQLGYVGTQDGRLLIVDLLTGTTLNEINIGEPLNDITLYEDLIIVDAALKLYVLGGIGITQQILGEINSPAAFPPSEPGTQVFASDEVAYVGGRQGLYTYDLGTPSNVRALGSPSTAATSVHDMKTNGAGMLIATTSFNLPSNLAVTTMDVSDPRQTENFTNSIDTPGWSWAVSLYDGLAYVADGREGLTVVNYQAQDTGTIAPTIALDVGPRLQTGGVEETRSVRVSAIVSDDVEVGRVMLYLNGELFSVDGSHPFDFRFPAPLLVGGGESEPLTIRALAVDRAGNSTWSEELTVTLFRFRDAPEVAGQVPEANGFGTDVRVIQVLFTKPINQATLNASTITVTEAGPDQTFGTDDDVDVPFESVSFVDEIALASIKFDTLLAPGIYQVVLSPDIEDQFGTGLLLPEVWTFLAGRTTDRANPPFLNPKFFIGTIPNVVLMEDLDGDGLKDVVVLSGSAANYSYLLNDGFGGFTARTQFEGLENFAVQDGLFVDVDGDGRRDLITARAFNTDAVEIHYRDPSLSFSGTVSVPLETDPYALAAGDLTGNGFPDFAVTLPQVDMMAVIVSNDQGTTFTETQRLAAGDNPQDVVMLDVDGDGDLDILVACRSSHELALYLNDGSGNMAEAILLAGVNLNSLLVVEDMDGDGNLDVLTTNNNPRGISIFWGNGAGGFSPPQNLPLETVNDIVATDHDGDGNLDIVAVTTNSDVWHLWYGLGRRDFQEPQTQSITDGPFAAFAGDMNNDGMEDLLFAGTQDTHLTVLYNQAPELPIQDKRVEVISGQSPTQLLPGHFNNDGVEDFLLRPGNSAAFQILIQDESGDVTANVLNTALPSPSIDAAVGDLNGNGLDDAAFLLNDKSVQLAINQGDGTFVLGDVWTFSTGEAVVAIALGDLNRDGFADLIGANDLNEGSLSVAFNDQAGGFTEATDTLPTDGSRPQQVFAIDVDGDGDLDLVATHRGGTFFAGIGTSVHRNAGGGLFTDAAEFIAGTVRPVHAVAEDINHDGLPDLIVVDGFGGQIQVLPGRAGGAFDDPYFIDVNGEPTFVAVADIDNDGDRDLLIVVSGQDKLDIAYNGGFGTFPLVQSYSVGNAPRSFVVADIDGDGDLDVVVANSSSNDLSVLEAFPLE